MPSTTIARVTARTTFLFALIMVLCAASQAQNLSLRLKNDPTNLSADPANMPKQLLVNGVGLKVVEPTEAGDQKVDFKVVKFVVIVASGGNVVKLPAEGANFTSEHVALFRKLKPGTTVQVESIKVRGPDNTVRGLPAVEYQIK